MDVFLRLQLRNEKIQHVTCRSLMKRYFTVFQEKLSKRPDAVEMLLLQQQQHLHRLNETSRFVLKNFEKPVGYWLLGSAGLCSLVVCLGGYTRLTESGLSITDWKFTGRSLPYTEKQWITEFNKYKDTLEYQQVHYGMLLDEFKIIYRNEWIHRMAARATGLLFASGAFYFGLIKRVFTSRMYCITGGLSSLFIGQGLLGWWMVKSGFEERTEQIKTPRVSPYRLAAHLIAATVLVGCLLWSSFNLLLPPSVIHLTAASCGAALQARKVAPFLFPFAPLTFLSGVFVAGNDAGHSYNTWPKMIDRWIPKEVYEITSNWKHVFENDGVVQFNHRILAYSTVIANSAWFLYVRNLPLSPKPRKYAFLMARTSGMQMTLGIITLLAYVPVSLGVLHQMLGLGVMSASILSAHTLRMPLWYLRMIKA